MVVENASLLARARSTPAPISSGSCRGSAPASCLPASRSRCTCGSRYGDRDQQGPCDHPCLSRQRQNPHEFATINSLQPLSKGQDVQFVALGAMGQPFPAQEYEDHWRSRTPTGKRSPPRPSGATSTRRIRRRRKETLSYRGVHIVEASSCSSGPVNSSAKASRSIS